MKLGPRLALLSTMMLSLPLAGWQLVRSLERDLRDSYQQAIVDTAVSIADEIASLPVSLPEANAFYLHQALRPISVDGYSSEWTTWLAEAQPLPGQGPDVRVVAAEHRRRLHLLVMVDDPDLTLSRPGLGPGDRVELEIIAEGRSGAVEIAPAAPGWLRTTGIEGWPAVQAALQPREGGWTMEIALESRLPVSKLGLRVVDLDEREDGAPLGLTGSRAPRPVARPSDALARRLDALLPDNTRGWATAPDGWILARAGTKHAASPDFDPHDEGWLLATAAARLLGVLPDQSPLRTIDQDRLDPSALAAEPVARWSRMTSGRGFLISAVAPIRRGNEVAGHVVIERPADRFMARAYRSLLQLFVFGLAGLLLAAIVLIGFAAWLAGRIRRLRDAAESSVGHDGQVRQALPLHRGSDEIADLERSLARIIDRQRKHQDYLQTLAAKLSHELRTPLAMIRSSLDNLAEVDDEGAQERYRQRAREGCLRLQRMFQAMSQAARIEEGLGDEPMVELDLGSLVKRYVEGCRETFGGHGFAAVVPPDGTALIQGASEQLAQLLDKLVENAVEFSPRGSRIILRVVPQGPNVSLQIDNPGSRLPRGENERLFESMVSRRSGGNDGAHLGLGLHIVRLIALRHGAHARALDRPEGVRVQVEFPRSGKLAG